MKCPHCKKDLKVGVDVKAMEKFVPKLVDTYFTGCLAPRSAVALGMKIVIAIDRNFKDVVSIE